MKVYIRCFWPGADQSQSSRGYATRTRFEQILIAKMFMKTALDQADLARIWDTSQSLISKICLKWCPRWGDKSRLHMRLQKLPMHFFEASQPEGFKERYHTIPATETDGKDLRMENIRKDNLGKRLQNSSKYGMASLRWIAWSIPGTGLTTLVTDLFAARISECEIVRLHSQWLIIFPPDTSRLVDRGFAFCTEFYPNLNIAFVPAFMRGRTQMFPIEIINARRMSQDRYTCECVFSRVAQHKMLKGILRYELSHDCPVNCLTIIICLTFIRYEHIQYATDAAHCGHFAAQLMQPMIQPAGWQEFIDESCNNSKYPKPLDLKQVCHAQHMHSTCTSCATHAQYMHVMRNTCTVHARHNDTCMYMYRLSKSSKGRRTRTR